MSDAGAMITACFQHQHPDAYDRAPVDAPPIPANLRYGTDAYPDPTPALPEEPSGNPDAQPIRVEDDGG